jgi:hypothetical protein
MREGITQEPGTGDGREDMKKRRERWQGFII